MFSVMLSSPSYAKWEKVGITFEATFYVDVERIRKVDGFVYFWQLIDYGKPSPHGHLSGIEYRQGDCKLFRYKGLSLFLYKKPMGKGTEESHTIPKKFQGWQYPSPNRMPELILKKVCALKK